MTVTLVCTITVHCFPATAGAAEDKNEVQKIIAEAQKLPLKELYKRAIKESHGKILYGIGNSSRGATAATGFLRELKAVDPSYSGKIEWSQPKNNSIFTLINADINSAVHTYSMTLIQDGNQIQSKMLDTGSLLNYIPKEWSESRGTNEKDNGHPFALQTLNKVFMFNNRSKADYSNCWNFVDKGVQPLFMGVDSEPVGKNFLYMLTMDKYADYMKTAFDALPAEKRAYFQKTIDSVAAGAASLGLTSKNVKYSLAWIKL